MGRDLRKEPLRIGVLGCGSFMQRRILPAVSEVDTIKVVALHKRKLTEAQAVAKRFGVASAVDSREALLAHPDVEAVFIATPNDCHENDALACVAAGKQTICEKPLAPTAEAAWRMVNAFNKASLPLLAGLSMRFRSTINRARTLYREGSVGALQMFRARFCIPIPADNWRLQAHTGGGVLQDLGVHIIDMLRYVTGEEVVDVTGMADSSYATGGNDRTMTVLLRLSSGALASIEVSFVQPFQSGFEIVGETGILEGRNCLRQSYDPGETLCHVTSSGRHFLKLEARNMYVDEVAHIAETLGNGSPSIIDGIEGAKAQDIIEAIYEDLHQRETPETSENRAAHKSRREALSQA